MSFDLSLKLTEFWKTNADIKTVVNFVKANQGSEYRIRRLKGTKETFLGFPPMRSPLRLTFDPQKRSLYGAYCLRHLQLCDGRGI